MKFRQCLIFAMVLAAMTFGGTGSGTKGDQQMDFSRDKFLLGNWECEAHLADGTTGRERATYKLVLGDQWLYLEYTLTPNKGPKHEVQAYEAYDPSLKKWVYSAFTSDGRYGQSFSDGWQGTSKVYVPAPNEPTQFRLTVTKINETEFTEKFELKETQGGYRESSSLHCRKV